MKKTVIIGDIHGRSVWKLITHTENPDKVIFVGDYFDSYDILGKEQIHNFEEIIQYKKNNPQVEVVMLIGNHDYHYFPEIGNVGTSGYQSGIAPLITQVVDENRHHLQMAHQMGEFLFSHAGVSSKFMDSVFGSDDWKTETIAEQLNELFKYKPKSFEFGMAVSIKKMSFLDPYGDNEEQSPIWIRPRSLMKANHDTLRNKVIQVVGHTQVRKIDPGKATGNRYWFIDCLETSGQYLVWQDNEVIIKSIK